MDVIELGEIMIAFENFSESTVNAGVELSLEDYQTFARKYQISLEKVVFTSDWCDDVLSQEVIDLKNELNSIIKIT